jgi:acyl carrier protein
MTAASAEVSCENGAPDMQDLKRKLKELLIERLKFEDMTPEDIGDDEPLFAGGLGLDSIDALEIVVMLESEFGIKVKNESAARTYFRSVASLADFVEQRLQQGAELSSQ